MRPRAGRRNGWTCSAGSFTTVAAPHENRDARSVSTDSRGRHRPDPARPVADPVRRSAARSGMRGTAGGWTRSLPRRARWSDSVAGTSISGSIPESWKASRGCGTASGRPGLQALYLVGDFNSWDRRDHPLVRDEYGVWSIFLPADPYEHRLLHKSRVKVHVVSSLGGLDRIPAYIRRAVYEPQSNAYTGQFWEPETPHVWRHEPPALAQGLRIYEAHVGMATQEHKVGSYVEFTRNVLPWIRGCGYNAMQLMAIQEHPYYGSFGYHVSSFFAASSRFGTPEELKAPDRHCPRDGPARVARSRAQPRRQEHAGRPEPVRRNGLPVLPRRPARAACGVGFAAVRLQQVRGAAVSLEQRALLAGGISLRRFPLRRRDQHDVSRSRAGQSVQHLRRLFRRQHRRGRACRICNWPTRSLTPRSAMRSPSPRRCQRHGGHGAAGR